MTMLLIFLLGMYFSLALYHLIIYFGRKSDRSNLCYAYLVLSFAFMTFTFSIIPQLTVLPYSLLMDIWHICILLGYFFVILSVFYYLTECLRLIRYKKIRNILLLFNIIYFIGFFYVTKQQGNIFRELSPWLLYIAMPPNVLFYIFLLFKFYIQSEKTKNERQLAIGIIFFGVFFCFHSLFLMLDTKEEYAIAFSNIGMVITVIIMAKLLSNNFNNEHRELKELKIHLEHLVKERTSELYEAKIKIEEQTRQKTDYFINLAHETKTPLTLITNYLNNYIKGHNEDPDLMIIKENIDKLRKDMVNFLTTEKIQQDRINYDHDQVCDVSSLTRQKSILFRQTVSTKNIGFMFEIADDLYIKADPSAFDTVLNNLLDNAFKYTEQGGRIRVTGKKENGVIKLIVSDTGIGIPAEQIKHIFQPYYQLSQKKQNRQGLGMGLYITKQIILAIGGELHVESQVGKGTDFILFIKYYNNAAKDNFSINAQKNVSEPSINVNITPDDLIVNRWDKNKNTVFLVEDNLQLIANLKKDLEMKFNFEFAVNGKDGLKKLYNFEEQQRPDIIIADIMMDEMDGYEFRKSLLATDEFKAIPFLFLTASDALDARLKGLSQGAVDYICKPFVTEELIEKIQSWLSLLTWNSSSTELERKYMQKLDSFISKYKLTPRQKDILHYLLQGYENRDIAEAMFISTNTVKTHIDNIKDSLGVTNKRALLDILYRYAYK